MSLRPLLELATKVLRPDSRVCFIIPVFDSQLRMGLFWEGFQDERTPRSQNRTPLGFRMMSLLTNVTQLLPVLDASMQVVSVIPTPCRSKKMQRLLVTVQKKPVWSNAIQAFSRYSSVAEEFCATKEMWPDLDDLILEKEEGTFTEISPFER